MKVLELSSTSSRAAQHYQHATLVLLAHRLVCRAAKELHFNKNGEAMKRMQAGVDKLASVVGITLGPRVSARRRTR
jgi:hypothetical protein